MPEAKFSSASHQRFSGFDGGPLLTIPVFLEMLSAFHFARMVPSPIQDASGLMVVAPSGSLKSQLLMYIQRCYPTSCICDSNWHYGKLLNMRASFYNLAVRSIVVPELSSIYAGDPRTGGRMEAMLQQMAGEGSITTNERDSRYERYEMRATVFAAMTPEFASRKHKGWEEGFHRRFLWAHLAMENEDVLMDWLTAGKQAQLDIMPIVEPPEKYIPDTLDFEQRTFVRSLLASQKDFGPNHTRFMFMCRAAAVLKWHYERCNIKRDWQETMKSFSACLGNRAALLIVPPEPTAIRFRKQVETKQLKESRNGKEKNAALRSRTAKR
jgi:hypothetical protein